MEVELVNRISDLTFASFYDESLGMAVVHFFNKDANKPDIVAYLLSPGMCWDVREVVNETSALNDDGEVITISHEPLGLYPHKSNFDLFMRKAIVKMSQEEGISTIDGRVLVIIENNSYAE